MAVLILLILMVAVAAFAFAAYRVYFHTSLQPAAPISDTLPPSRSVVASIAAANQPPFANLLISLLQNNSEGFIYWRGRLYETGAGDVQEYVTRVIDAAYSAGKLDHYYRVLAEAVCLIEPLKSDRKLRSTFQAQYAGLLTLLAELNTSIRDTIFPLQQLLSYNRYPRIIFTQDEGDLGKYASMLEFGRNQLADSKEWNEVQRTHAVTDRVQVAIVMGRDDAAAAAGMVMGAHRILIGLETETPTSWVCLRAAVSVSRLLGIAPAYLEGNGSALMRSLTLQCASHVSPDDFDFPLLSSSFREAKLQLPKYNPLPTGGITIYCSGEKITKIQKATGLAAAISAEGSPADAKPDPALELESMEGLASVKNSVTELRSLLAANAARQEANLPITPLSLHSVFLGNPGTGKTTVARIYAGILKQYGFLSSGQLIEADRSKLVAEYAGQTATKTLKVLKESLGGVLFIDEAYSLKHSDPDPYGQECVDTLLKFMDDHRDDLAVVMAGYTDEMRKLLDSNPGFKSRFTQYFRFEDYTDEQLSHILLAMAKERGYSLSADGVSAAVELLSRERSGKGFGNARAVRNVLEQAIRRQAVRLVPGTEKTKTNREELMSLEKSDFLGSDGKKVLGAEDALAALVGLSTVKETIREYKSVIELAKTRSKDPRELLQPYFVMLGNPGTGKTTVARILGGIFRDLGYLPTDNVVETDREGLVAGYVGQKAIKTRAVLESALGGTLFIDEAYSLVANHGTSEDFGREAIDTLLKFMEDNRGRLVIIAAGYEKEIRDFLASNPGLRSRFTNIINFPDYSPAECVEIFVTMLTRQGLKLEQGIETKLPALFQRRSEGQTGQMRVTLEHSWNSRRELRPFGSLHPVRKATRSY